MCSALALSDLSSNEIRFYKGVGIESKWVNGSMCLFSVGLFKMLLVSISLPLLWFLGCLLGFPSL